jgi:hypothetical protein
MLFLLELTKKDRNMDNKMLNPVNIVRSTIGKRRIFIHTTSNPKMVTLNSDLSGLAVNVKIMSCLIDATTAQPFYQLEFGEGALHTQANNVEGARASCFQVLGNASREKVPVKFNSDYLPQYFKLSIYNPGEPATLTSLDTNGAQIWIEYDYIAQ